MAPPAAQAEATALKVEVAVQVALDGDACFDLGDHAEALAPARAAAQPAAADAASGFDQVVEPSLVARRPWRWASRMRSR
ncbi:MAG: hypothetical protein R2701_07380 [Acidimicrobiales bacterium]